MAYVVHMANTPPAPRLGRIVADKLEAAGMSTLHASTDSHIPLTTLRRRLAGDPFRTDELHALACILGTHASILMAEAEDAA